MDTVLVVNAGSSSVKFQVFAMGEKSNLARLIKGQADGIGTRPKLRAEGADKKILLNQDYPREKMSNVPSAILEIGAWLRENHDFKLAAIGHRVVHGGPDYNQPIVVDQKVLAKLEQCISRTTSLRSAHC
jgi:acetate kinase